ncbi:MAG: cupin domain-containing protein [Thiotrichales bacterium]|jgi:uncharacterized cupin superfamily protein|nr:cupin domain-containing protein [Thiotrichales bacterium]
MRDNNILAVNAIEVLPCTTTTIYPEPFASLMVGREKRRLGDFFGLKNFGVNLTYLAPKAISALRHAHSKQDEFVYVLQGYPTLHTDKGPIQLSPGMCSGMRAGSGQAYSLSNETASEVVYLEIGDRAPEDEVVYPDHDLRASFINGNWKFSHKDGTPY